MMPSQTERGGIQAQETRGEGKIKAEVMDDGWVVGAAVSRLLIPGSEISFPRGFPKAVPHESSSSLSPAPTKSRGQPRVGEPVTFDNDSAGGRV